MDILTSDVLTQLIWSLPSLGLVAVAIVVIVAYSRYKKNELEKRSQIILTALEKGAAMCQKNSCVVSTSLRNL